MPAEAQLTRAQDAAITTAETMTARNTTNAVWRERKKRVRKEEEAGALPT